MGDTDHENWIPDINYIIHRKCTSDWKIENSIIDFIDVTYIVKGSAQYQIDHNNFNVSAGDLLCIPKGALRAALSSPHDLMECYAVNFQMRTLFGEDATLPFPLICHIGHHSDIVALYNELNYEWLRRAPGHRMKTRALFMFILQRFSELIIYQNDSGNIDKRIMKAIRYIAEHFNEPLTIQNVAQLSGLNQVYFGALFRQATSMTFRQYLTAIRLNQAENMLKSGEYNVNEAALHCGFSDIFYFSKVYKSIKGLCPSKVFTSSNDR